MAIDERSVGASLVHSMGERGTVCLCGRPTKNRRYCSQECYREYRNSNWQNDVPLAMRRKLLRMLEESI